ncbi:MAG: four helix bundle protein [Flavobacteriaceae bacterium]|nr:four helix bundle protein [Flavobacteriaceae bacterium]
MRDFKKYKVWELSHQFVLKIYGITEQFPQKEVYGITSQLRRASSSVPTNIAEGCGRKSDTEFSRFLTIALGSASEVEYLLILSKDLKFISEEDYQMLNEEMNTIKRKIYTLKTKLSASV